MRLLYIILILTLLLVPINTATLFTAPALADTYLKVIGNQQSSQTGGFSVANMKYSDDAYGGINYVAGYSVANEWKHSVVVGDFAQGYKEEDYGYIGSIEVGVEYRLWPDAFAGGGTETFEVMVREKGQTINEPSWLRYWNNPYPTVDNSVVGSAGNDTIWEQAVTPDVYDFYKTWARINATAADSKGFDIRCIWTPGGGLTSTTKVYIDQMWMRVLVKLIAFGEGLNMGMVVTESTKDIPLLWMTLKSYSNTTINVTQLDVVIEGTVAWSDVESIKIYRDLDEDKTISAGDTMLSSATPTSSIVSVTASPAIPNVPHDSKYIIAASLKDNIIPGAAYTPEYIGLRIVDHTDFVLAAIKDQVLADGITGRTALNVVDTVNPNPLFPIKTGDINADRVKVLRKASVTTVITNTSPTTVNIGDPITLTVRATNPASSGTAENVIFNPPVIAVTVSGSPAVTAPNEQTPVTLLPGQFHDFSVTVYAMASGSFYFTETCNYDDVGNTFNYNTGVSFPSALITINAALVPILSVTNMSVSPTNVSHDQTFTMSMSVKNVGYATANNVGIFRPSDNALWSFDSYAGSTATVTPVVGTPVKKNIAVGATETWTFDFTPSSTGIIKFSCYAKADNSNQMPKASNWVTIEQGGALAIAGGGFYPSPASPIGRSGVFNVVLRISNSGSADVINVNPPTLSITKSAGSPLTPNPMPSIINEAVNAVVPGGGYHDFVWVVDSNCETDLGWVDIAIGATSGNDENSNAIRTSNVPASITNYVIDNLIHPRANPLANADIDMMIGYSYNSEYYAISTASRLYAYDSLGGQKWSYDLKANLNQDVSGLDIWVTEMNSQTLILIGTVSGRIYAIRDLGTSVAGYSLWSPNITSSFLSLDDAPIWGMAQFGNNLYVTAGGSLYEYDFDTRLKIWEWNPPMATNIECIPAMNNNFVYVSLQNGYVYSIAKDTGFTGQNINAGGQATNPLFWANKLYFTTEAGKVYKINLPETALDTANTLTLGGALSDCWVSLDGSTLFCVDNGDKLFKVDVTPAGNPTLTATRDFSVTYGVEAIANLAPPLELWGKVYLGSNTSGNVGKAWVLNTSDLLKVNADWPYNAAGSPSGFFSPVTLDVWNNMFLLGSRNNRVYFFGIP